MKKENYKPDNEINRLLKSGYDHLKKWALIITVGVSLGLAFYYGSIYLDSLLMK